MEGPHSDGVAVVAVLKIANVAACKLCKHPKRDEIDAWIEKRSNKERIGDQNVNLQYVLERLAELGVENPTEDNVKNHWKKHCEKIADDVAAETAAKEAAIEEELKNEALAIMERILGKDWRSQGLTPTPEQIGELHRALYAYEMELRVRQGLPVSITHDHVLKSIAETTKRKGEESQTELLRTLGKGIEGAFKALGAAKQPALPEPIEDAEYEEVA